MSTDPAMEVGTTVPREHHSTIVVSIASLQRPYCHCCNNNDNDVVIVVFLCFYSLRLYWETTFEDSPSTSNSWFFSSPYLAHSMCLALLLFSVLLFLFCFLRFPLCSQRCTSRKLQKLRSSREVRFFSRSTGSKTPRKFEIIMKIYEHFATRWYLGGRANLGGGWLGGGGEGRRGGLTAQEASKTENGAHVRCQRIPPWKWVPRCTESTTVLLLWQYRCYNYYLVIVAITMTMRLL